MPIHKTSSGGYQWGQHGHVYPSRAGAERQAAAAHAHGYRGDDEGMGADDPLDGRRDASSPGNGEQWHNEDWPGSQNRDTGRAIQDEGRDEKVLRERARPPSLLNAREALADGAEDECAGILFQAPGPVYLLLHRTDREEWEGPGGHVEDGETPEATAARETEEETGFASSVAPEFVERSAGELPYSLYLHRVPLRFYPRLNEEHDRYGWFTPGALPAATHPQLVRTIEGLTMPRLDARSYGPDHDGLNAAYDRGTLRRTPVHDCLHVGNDGTRILADRSLEQARRHGDALNTKG